MNCAGCCRKMQDGDMCIRGTLSELIGLPKDDVVDDLTAALFGGGGEKPSLVLCESCIMPGAGEGFDIEVYHDEPAPEVKG